MPEQRDYQPLPEEAYFDWLNTFYICLRDNKAKLLLNNLELSPVTEAWAELKEVTRELRERREEVERKYEAARLASEELRAAEGDLTLTEARIRDTKAQAYRDVEPLARKIQESKRVTETLKAELGLLPSNYYPALKPNPPILKASTREDGSNFLEWDRNGNPEGTRYAVKCAIVSRKNTYHTGQQSPRASDLDKPGACLTKTTELFYVHSLTGDGTSNDWAYAWYVVAVLDAYDREVPDLRSEAFSVCREEPQEERPGGIFGTIFGRFGKRQTPE